MLPVLRLRYQPGDWFFYGPRLGGRLSQGSTYGPGVATVPGHGTAYGEVWAAHARKEPRRKVRCDLR